MTEERRGFYWIQDKANGIFAIAQFKPYEDVIIHVLSEKNCYQTDCRTLTGFAILEKIPSPGEEAMEDPNLAPASFRIDRMINVLKRISESAKRREVAYDELVKESNSLKQLVDRIGTIINDRR